jgi:acetyltransferase-like isoleucine patch superfamily enzyme
MSMSSTAIMQSRVVLGAGDMLEIACRAWSETSNGETVTRLEIAQAADYTFDFSVFDGQDPAGTFLFVALDERFGNFKRMEIMQAAMSRGFQLATIRAPGAAVAADARLGPNVFVGAGAIIGAGVLVDFNTIVNAGAIVGFGARLKASCWIEGGAVIGNRAEIGAHAILRAGVVVAPRVKIGRHCEIGVPGLYRTDVVSKTVFDPRYDEPLVVYGG